LIESDLELRSQPSLPAANPVVVEITRGPMVESRHRGAIAAVDASGAVVLAIGDVAAPVYPRSAVKALQALPLVESGAAAAFHLTDAELALACSSHNAEPMHVAAARRMLAKAGLGETALECGAQWPRLEADRTVMARTGARPGPIHNNCSGKHAGMLALGRHLMLATAGYADASHPIQQRVRATLEAMTGESLGAAPCGIDGCSIPTYAVPLTALARAFARFAAPEREGAARAAAIRRLTAACFAHPEMVAGTGRYCTEVLKALAGLAFVKTGAEGVFCAALPTLGLGVALKCDDGAGRASEAMMSAVLLALLGGSIDEDRAAAVRAAGFSTIRNWRGREVGTVRAAGPLAGGLPL
jgi:L-asparaginase II